MTSQKNYKFQRLNNPSAHPFYVGDSGYNADSSDNLIIAGDGTSTTGISNNESFTLFFRDGFTVEHTLSYFCTVHSSMISDFTLTEPTVLVDIPTVATSTGIHTSLVAALAQTILLLLFKEKDHSQSSHQPMKRSQQQESIYPLSTRTRKMIHLQTYSSTTS